jgi:hypothetical protein
VSRRFEDHDARCRAWVERVVAAAPPLSAEQSRQLERLLCNDADADVSS